MRKPINTKVHGIIDYMTAGLLVTLPRVMGWSRGVTRMLDAAAVTTAGYSLMTRYEMGPLKVLPMKAHLAMDAVQGAAMIGAGVMLEDEDPDVRLTLGALGVFELAVTALSQSEPRRATTSSRGARRGGGMFAGSAGGQSMPTARGKDPAVAAAYATPT